MTAADLRNARKALGLTQRGLAEALHMGKWGWQTISAWESGRAAIPADLHLKMTGLAANQLQTSLQSPRKNGAD